MKRIILILLLFTGGCDLLTTRTPEEPENRDNNYSTPTTTDVLISNLKQSFADGYTEYYLECFVDETYLSKEFTFTPSAAAYQISGWSLDDEKQYFNKLKTIIKDNTSVTLTFSNLVYSPQGDNSIITADYKITFSPKDSSFPSEYQGSLQFNAYLDSRNQWVIVNWQDMTKDDYYSWSELKRSLY